MDTLTIKVAIRMATGFAIGAMALLTLICLDPASLGHGRGIDAIVLCLQLWAFGAPFSVGFLCTSMAFEADDRRR